MTVPTRSSAGLLEDFVDDVDAGPIEQDIDAAVQTLSGDIDDSNIPAGANISGRKIADRSIPQAKLATQAIGTVNLADLAVTSEKINAAAVGVSDLDFNSLTEGFNGTPNFASLVAVTSTNSNDVEIADLSMTIPEAGCDQVLLFFHTTFTTGGGFPVGVRPTITVTLKRDGTPLTSWSVSGDLIGLLRYIRNVSWHHVDTDVPANATVKYTAEATITGLGSFSTVNMGAQITGLQVRR